MSKSIRLNQQHAKTDAELLNALHASAKKYSMFADNKLLYIYRANTKNAPYKCYEVFFGRDNFIHLVEFKRDKINATQFLKNVTPKPYNSMKQHSKKIAKLLQQNWRPLNNF